jgi:hypothetical protein
VCPAILKLLDAKAGFVSASPNWSSADIAPGVSTAEPLAKSTLIFAEGAAAGVGVGAAPPPPGGSGLIPRSALPAAKDNGFSSFTSCAAVGLLCAAAAPPQATTNAAESKNLLPITNSLKTRRKYNTRLIYGKYVASSERKRFFFEKKKQKTFAPAGFGTTPPQPPVNESFLLLFSKKKRLLTLPEY